MSKYIHLIEAGEKNPSRFTTVNQTLPNGRLSAIRTPGIETTFDGARYYQLCIITSGWTQVRLPLAGLRADFEMVFEPPIELGQWAHIALTDGDSGNPSGGAKVVVELDIDV